jgi:hypothetical protein
MYVDAFAADGWEDAEAVGVKDGIPRMGERNDAATVGVRDGIPRMGERNVIDGMSHRAEIDRLVIELHHVVGKIAVDEQQHVDVRDVGNVMLHANVRDSSRGRERQPSPSLRVTEGQGLQVSREETCNGYSCGEKGHLRDNCPYLSDTVELRHLMEQQQARLEKEQEDRQEGCTMGEGLSESVYI